MRVVVLALACLAGAAGLGAWAAEPGRSAYIAPTVAYEAVLAAGYRERSGFPDEGVIFILGGDGSSQSQIANTGAVVDSYVFGDRLRSLSLDVFRRGLPTSDRRVTRLLDQSAGRFRVRWARICNVDLVEIERSGASGDLRFDRAVSLLAARCGLAL